jgi:hypothetical protein
VLALIILDLSSLHHHMALICLRCENEEQQELRQSC